VLVLVTRVLVLANKSNNKGYQSSTARSGSLGLIAGNGRQFGGDVAEAEPVPGLEVGVAVTLKKFAQPEIRQLDVPSSAKKTMEM
jgi:hypothetical protein